MPPDDGSSRAVAPGRPMDERLQVLVDRVWPHASDPAAGVSVQLASVVPGHVVAEEYVILPHPSRPQLLVPVGSQRAVATAFRAFNAAKAPRTRLVRGGLGAAFGLQLGEKLFRHRLVVGVDPAMPAERRGEVLVLQHLAGLLGHPRLLACMRVHRINPNTKPTLQLLDDKGSAIGYAKLGSTPAGREMVRSEAAAASALAGGPAGMIVPRLLGAGDWNDMSYSITEPLPPGMGRWTTEPAAAPHVNRAVAESSAIERVRLRDSAYVARIRRQLAETTPAAPEASQVLAAWLDRLVELHGSTELAFGRMHGDWTPWNLGTVGDVVAAWDWEHSAADAPLGLDILHWYFQQALDESALPAAVAAVDAATRHLGGLEVAPGARPLVASLYLLDIFVRRTRLAVGGGGWNARWYPGLLDVAAARDAVRG